MPTRLSIGSRVVDAHAIKWLLENEATWNGHMNAPESIAWVPHHDQLIVSWRGANDTKAPETQLIASVDLKDGECRTLTVGFEPVVSSDGRHVAFVSRTSGSLQIYVMNADGSGIQQLTNRKGGVVGAGFGYDAPPFAWSPNSRSIAYVTHHFLYGYGNSMSAIGGTRVHVYSSDPSSSPSILSEPIAPEIRTIDLDTGADRLAVQAYRDTWVNWVGWSPNGRLFFDESHFFHADDFHSIVAFDPATRKTSTVVRVAGMQKWLNPTFVDDGTKLLYLTDPVFPTYDIVDDFAVTNIGGKKTSYWTRDFRWLYRFYPQWDNRTHTIFSVGMHGSAYGQIYRLRRGQQPESVTRGSEDVQAFALSSERASIAWLGLDPYGQVRLHVANEDGSSARALVRLHPEFDGLKMSRIEEIHYRSSDGLELPALIVYPMHYDARRRYPTIVQIHGGGFSSRLTLDGTIIYGAGPLEWQYWASLGYAMVITDYRITGTYGHKPVQEAIANHDYYERDCADVEGAVNYAIAHGIADPNRLGVFGVSYGGTHTNFLITHDHRYRAAISYEGWGNEFYHNESAIVKLSHEELGYLYGGTQWDVPQRYVRESSVFHTKNVKTATMFVSGNPNLGSEPRDDPEFLYASFRDQGVPSELIQYEDEGHVLHETQDQMDLLARSTVWFDKHLMHAKGPAASNDRPM
ncbi:MAG TPA: prolyl oligopeptidase family serine peptidase [Candidatus Baltobacteraceae bacterium]